MKKLILSLSVGVVLANLVSGCNQSSDSTDTSSTNAPMTNAMPTNGMASTNAMPTNAPTNP